MLDIEKIRRDFPILDTEVRGKPLVYLDNAASTQKPRSVIDAVSGYYESANANVHRGVHYLSERATDLYDGARATVASFVNAPESREVIFVRGTTEGINLVAASWGRANVGAGDNVVITEMEHHSNIVPWQLLCEEKGAELRVVPISDRGELLLGRMEELLSERTKIVAAGWISNALGTVNPVRRITEMAHAAGALVLLDAAQAAPHQAIDVQAVGCDFLAFSGHKVYAPTGIGALWGRAELLEKMPPYQGGGDMILSVSFAGTVYNKVPEKFEAGTPNIGGVVGLAAALDYVSGVGLDSIAAHEAELLRYATERIAAIDGVRIIGTAEQKASVLSFTVDGIHPHDLGSALDLEGIAIRAGHHCAQPVMEHFGVAATARASIGIYNNRDDVDRLVASVRGAKAFFDAA